jgi:hypothetical protein
MRLAFKGLVVLGAALLLSGTARADVPNFNKRGTSEAEQKAFCKSVGETIVKAARKCKDITLQDCKFKEVKPGRTDLMISMGYKGVITGTKYTADITIHIDSSTKDKWELTKIVYKDNNKQKLTLSDKKLNDLVEEFNKAAK